MFERILAAIDTEGLASDAVARASDLAASLEAKLSVVHAVDVPSAMWPGINPQQLEAIHAEALASARLSSVEMLRPVLGREFFESGGVVRVLPGPPAKVVLRRVREWCADLLVLGGHAKRGTFDFGATARAVLSRCEIPVWVQAQPVVPIKSILVGVDFSEHSRKALAAADSLAERLGASLHVLACYVPPAFAYSGTTDVLAGPVYTVDHEANAMEKELEAWMAEFPWRSKQAESAFACVDPVDEIPRAAEQHDLIVVGTHGRSGLSRFLLGSVAYGVLRRATTPVLVVPDTSRTWLLGGTSE